MDICYWEEEEKVTKFKINKFRVEKVIKKKDDKLYVIKRKDDKLYVKWNGYYSSFNTWIDKKDIV